MEWKSDFIDSFVEQGLEQGQDCCPAKHVLDSVHMF
jgi:hypothetical protein